MVAFFFRLPSASPGLRFRRQHKASCRRPPGAIPTSPPLRGTTPFRLSPWALGTQQLVRFRCLASPLATSTPLLALDRLILTLRIQIRPLALQHFCLRRERGKRRQDCQYPRHHQVAFARAKTIYFSRPSRSVLRLRPQICVVFFTGMPYPAFGQSQ